MKFVSRDLDKLKTLLSSDDQVLVTTHIRPDPDAIGSVLAIREMVKQLGSVAHAILEDECPPRCGFLPGADEILTLSETKNTQRYKAVVIVDAGDRGRVGDVERLISTSAEIVNIDHHSSNEHFGTLNFVYPDTAACGELLYFLIKALSIELTQTLATNLYAGLVTDTGRFRHTNTTSRSLQVGAALIDAGADAAAITDHLYYDIAAQDIRSIGIILGSLELHGRGEVSTMLVKLDQSIEDPDHVVDFARAINGVEVAALLSEMKDGKIRVSMRSKARVDVSKIAESFGGGGHVRAAGFRMIGTLTEVRDKIVPVLLKAVKDSSA
ncbi:bifunctional oligoribonuclease/PAP phosphatase NrnA [bacterium]|nr:bifunctional oligoribonuclease/PAP phosphatase NrnA [bacterium]